VQLHYTWVIPYGIGLALLATAYTRFLFHISRRSAILFIFAGICFVIGALVMELITGHVYQAAGARISCMSVFKRWRKHWK